MSTTPLRTQIFIWVHTCNQLLCHMTLLASAEDKIQCQQSPFVWTQILCSAERQLSGETTGKYAPYWMYLVCFLNRWTHLFVVVIYIFQGPICLYGITLIPAWVRNYIHYKIWYKIIYLFPNTNGRNIDIWEWITNSIPQLTQHVITCHPGIAKSLLVKEDPGWSANKSFNGIDLLSISGSFC